MSTLEALPSNTATTADASPTSYVVLTMGGGEPEYWEVLKTVEARTAEAAVRAIGKEGTYVAVPARSWRPVTVKAETQTVLKLESAK